MNTTLNKIAVRVSVLSFFALSFSSIPVLGANGSDSFIQGIISPLVPSWIEIPALANLTPSTTPSDPNEIVPEDFPKPNRAPKPSPTQSIPDESVPEGVVESTTKASVPEYLPPKSARH